MAISLPKGARGILEARADLEGLTVSQYVWRAINTAELTGALETARLDMLVQARKHDIYTDEDVFRFLS
jgi:hypothetical protein